MYAMHVVWVVYDIKKYSGTHIFDDLNISVCYNDFNFLLLIIIYTFNSKNVLCHFETYYMLRNGLQATAIFL